MEHSLVTIICVVVLVVLLLIGCPIFVSLGITSILGIFLLEGFLGLSRVPASIFTHIDNFVLLAVPLFLLMGQTLFISGIGSDLFIAGSKWLAGLKGQLAMGSVIACAVFGAMSGISVVGAATIGAFAIPEMVKAKYHPRLAAGTVAAAGALSILIPPSIIFIIYGGIADVSVAKLFIGGIVPGIVLALLMCAFVWLWVKKYPWIAPETGVRVSFKERVYSLKRLWPALILIFLCLITIYIGVCTPTEAGALGAFGAIVVGIFFYHSLNYEAFRKLFADTARVTGAVLIIVCFGSVFSSLLAMLRLPDKLAEFAISSGLSRWGFIVLINLILIVLGMFVDAASAVIITTPIVLPTIIGFGFDPLWYGIILAINMEMAVITPPVGLNLYVIKSICPEISLEDIIRGAVPFVIVECICLAIFVIFEDLTLWLPGHMR